MPKTKLKPKTAIYHPPKKGMPYLVVTVSPEGVVAVAVEIKRRGADPCIKEDAESSARDSTIEVSSNPDGGG